MNKNTYQTFSDYIDQQEPQTTRTILSCTVRLDRKSMLDLLNAETIKIHQHYYKVPENKILICLPDWD